MDYVAPRWPDEGKIIVFAVKAEDEDALRAELARFGSVHEVEMGAEQAHVRFATHTQADDCVARMKRWPADYAYNATPYNGRGWYRVPRLNPSTCHLCIH